MEDGDEYLLADEQEVVDAESWQEEALEDDYILDENDTVDEAFAGDWDAAPEDEAFDEAAAVAEDEFAEAEEAQEEEEETQDAQEEEPTEPEVQEHLKESIEGSLRLKRLLSRDDEFANKKRKIITGDDAGGEENRPIVQAKVKQLMTRWGIMQDAIVKHVLENLGADYLKKLIDTNYRPNLHHQKTPAELLSAHVNQLKEQALGPGTSVDVVAAFRHRWKTTLQQEKQLRQLSHKDLRYVMNSYDGTSSLEDIIAEAAGEVPDDSSTIGAVPKGPGVKTIGRFCRLELIDPLADAAVFGDANLTFSLNLAGHRKTLGHVGRVIATTFEEIDTLRERYKEIDKSIRVLEDHHAEVYHGVDCTRVALDPRFEGMEASLGAVYYNYPHSGAIGGFFDSHPIVNWRHENLMRLFFRALRSFVKPGGIVKVSSNSSAVGVRYGYIIGSALENEFVHVETMPFLEWHLHRYGRSYGDRRDVYKRPDAQKNQSYNAQNASRDMVYCFRYEPSGKALGKQQIRMPPTLKTLQACKDGPFKKVSGAAHAKLAQDLHTRFVNEVSGIHVG